MKYIVAVDSSKKAEEAFMFTLKLVKENDSIVLIHITELNISSLLDPLHDRIDAVVNYENKIEANKIKQNYELLCTQAKVKSEFIIEESTSSPIEQILKFLLTLNEEKILVVGSRGKSISTLERIFLGSTSEALVREASCPCLIVH